jgi:parallel beta-helix repeat protein
MYGRQWVICLCFLIFTTSLFRVEAEGTTFHVDAARGSDDFTGTPSEPYKTISRASGMAQPGDTILIHKGVYHEQLSRGNSGTPDAPIIYAGTDHGKVFMQGSVRVKDWRRDGVTWVKSGLSPITHVNAFVMVDDKSMLKRHHSQSNLPQGSFYLSQDGTYAIRLPKDRNPNTDCDVDVYELDFAFNSGNRWGGTAKSHIVLRNLTIEKYGVTAVSTDAENPKDNSNWELDGIVVRYNGAEGVFHCLDDWYVHDCLFMRNRGHGCQINGARVRFSSNQCSENMWFGYYPDGGCGLLVGPDASAHSSVVTGNVFENNGGPRGYGCGIYLEGRSHHNLIENNLIVGGSHSGIGFFGSSHNTVINNILAGIAPANNWKEAAAFVVSHSYEGLPTQSVGNLVAHNTILGCPSPIFIDEPSQAVAPAERNRFVNNFFGKCRFSSPPPSVSVLVGEGNGCFLCPDGTRLHKTPLPDLGDEAPSQLEQACICDPPLGRAIGKEPRFQGPDVLDFRLKSNSPLIERGVLCPEVSKDRTGLSRPIGRRPAIGAYEHASNPD